MLLSAAVWLRFGAQVFWVVLEVHVVLEVIWRSKKQHSHFLVFECRQYERSGFHKQQLDSCCYTMVHKNRTLHNRC